MLGNKLVERRTLIGALAINFLIDLYAHTYISHSSQKSQIELNRFDIIIRPKTVCASLKLHLLGLKAAESGCIIA